MADLGGARPGAPPSFQSIFFFIFMQFSAKIVPNNSLPQPSGVDAPIPFPVGNPGSATKTTLDREKKLVLGSGG